MTYSNSSSNTKPLSKLFSQTLSQYPNEFQLDLKTIALNNGVLKAQFCQKICESLSINIEMLMVELLPLASSYSHAPVSDFNVGAIVCGLILQENEYPNLYFGANFEYSGEALCFSLHAEQAAISNAWQQGETGLKSLATSAAPCGHCRQFSYEVAGSQPFPILMPNESFTSYYLNKNAQEMKSKHHNAYISTELTELLPSAFGPKDLGCDQLLMEAHNKNISIPDKLDDVTKAAFNAALNSYAPYSQNYVGCAIEMKSGVLFTGRYAENAAHNPSLQAFTAAISQLILAGYSVSDNQVLRVVLVEKSTKTSQKNTTNLLVSAFNENIQLEYLTINS
jgi:cytidine deaminase